MANKKETAKAEETKKSPVESVNEENIVDQLREKNLQKDATVQAALDEIEKEKDEKKKREAKSAILKFEYKNLRALLQLRRRRQEDKATKAYLSTTKEIKDDYLAGKLTKVEADKKSDEAEANLRKEMDKIDNETADNVRELRQAYPNYYCWDWDRFQSHR